MPASELCWCARFDGLTADLADCPGEFILPDFNIATVCNRELGFGALTAFMSFSNERFAERRRSLSLLWRRQ
jgi:hypothetical protein